MTNQELREEVDRLRPIAEAIVAFDDGDVLLSEALTAYARIVDMAREAIGRPKRQVCEDHA